MRQQSGSRQWVGVHPAARPVRKRPSLLRRSKDQAGRPAHEVQENTEVVFSHVERTDLQQVVDVQVTEAEGRRVAGRCIVRNGKVFDYKG